MQHPNNLKEQTILRKELRNEGTAAEATLWLSLKGRQVEGMRWRRQFGVGPYILDFYCPQLHLCIELDGAPHYTIQGGENDLQREEWLLQEHWLFARISYVLMNRLLHWIRSLQEKFFELSKN